MEKVDLKIQSFIDVITNSSTEVFVMATEKTEQTIKEICEFVLNNSGESLKFEDVFELKYVCDVMCTDEDSDPDEYEDFISVELTPLEYKELDKNTLVERNDVYLEVIVKNPKYSKFGELLSNLLGTYEFDSCYYG